jgi:hypothetical protein
VIFLAKCPATSVYKLDITTEKVSSRPGIDCLELRECSRGTKIFIFCSRQLNSAFSGAIGKSDFCGLNTHCHSPGRLEFQGHSDRIVCGSKFLIKKSRGIFALFSGDIKRF